MAMGGDDLEPISGEETKEPVFGLTAYWIREDARLEAEELGYTVVDPTTIITTHIQNLVQTHADEILDRKATEELLKKLEKENSAVVFDVNQRLGIYIGKTFGLFAFNEALQYCRIYSTRNEARNL